MHDALMHLGRFPHIHCRCIHSYLHSFAFSPLTSVRTSERRIQSALEIARQDGRFQSNVNNAATGISWRPKHLHLLELEVTSSKWSLRATACGAPSRGSRGTSSATRSSSGRPSSASSPSAGPSTPSAESADCSPPKTENEMT